MSKGLNFNKGAAQSPHLLFLKVGWVGTVMVRTGRNLEETVLTLAACEVHALRGFWRSSLQLSPQDYLFPVGLSTDWFIFLILHIYSGNRVG